MLVPFVPIALESTGGFGTEALLFIKELIKESKKQHMVWRDKEYVNLVHPNIAIAVARGNTGIVKSGRGAAAMNAPRERCDMASLPSSSMLPETSSTKT